MDRSEAFFKSLVRDYSALAVLVHEPLKKHTTFQIGGPARFMVSPRNEEELCGVLRLSRAHEMPYYILGNGSNLLFSDTGVEALFVKTENLSNIEQSAQNRVTAACGVNLTKAAAFCRDRGLSGFEFAYGIPGSVGGAVYMNAGAYGGEIADIVYKTRYLNERGEIKTLLRDAHDFSYRESFFAKHPECVILSCEFSLVPAGIPDISEKMARNMKSRSEKQPLDAPSAGSVFKRPPGYFAGRLIEDAGLSGYKLGGARISEKHAGFIVSDGTATCGDVRALVSHIQKTVFSRFGVTLECEIRFID